MATKNDIAIKHDVFEQQFAVVDNIIAIHHSSAIVNINVETLLTCWEVGQYISFQLHNANWGSNVVGELADYLKRANPRRRGYSRRNLYNMVKFYETYGNVQFTTLAQALPLPETVQSATAQTSVAEFVQLPTAQIMTPMPNVLAVTTFTNHVEILNRCRTDNENPSIGIILCPSADRSAVEYTLSRSLSPTMVAEYQRKLIPQEVMKKSLEEYCSFLQEQGNH